MKDFSQLSKSLNTLQEGEINHHLRKALNLAASVSTLGGSLPSRYASLYAAVQMVKYSDDGTPQDITDASRNSVPDHQIHQELEEARKLKRMRDSLTNAKIANEVRKEWTLSTCDIALGGATVGTVSFNSAFSSTLTFNTSNSKIFAKDIFDLAFQDLNDVMSFSGGAVKAKIARCRLPEPRYKGDGKLVFIVYIVADGAATESAAGLFVIDRIAPNRYWYAKATGATNSDWVQVNFTMQDAPKLTTPQIPEELANEFVNKLISGGWTRSNHGPTYCADAEEVEIDVKFDLDVKSLVPNPDKVIDELEKLV